MADKKDGPNKVACGVVAILLGSLGVHKFMLGQTVPGIIMLCITILSCTFLAVIPGVIGLIEGIMYLTKSDDEFYQTYVVEKKAWF
jgi:TM2 domain-containing membrane protein YozV